MDWLMEDKGNEVDGWQMAILRFGQAWSNFSVIQKRVVLLGNEVDDH